MMDHSSVPFNVKFEVRLSDELKGAATTGTPLLTVYRDTVVELSAADG